MKSRCSSAVTSYCVVGGNGCAKMVEWDKRMSLLSTLSIVRGTGILDGWNGPNDVSVKYSQS